MSVAVLLDRLEAVKETAPDRWVAKCPAHLDRSPSLSIRILEDGKVLIRCFAGCGALDVLDALSLDWGALFPEGGHKGSPPSSANIPCRDLLVILDHELTVAVLILQDIVRTRQIGEASFERLCKASARVSKARIIANPAGLLLR